jgi:hypothetical protein
MSRGRPSFGPPGKAAIAVNLDPNTHAYVLGTAFFTSLFFALAAWLPVGFVLRALLLGT